MQGFSGIAQVIDNPPNTSNFTGGPLPGSEPSGGGAPTWDRIKSDPALLKTFSDNIGKLANDLAKGGIQGTASNVVAIRKVLTNLGFPQSEVEKTGGGFGQVHSQTSYSGSDIPPELREIINQKSKLVGKVLSSQKITGYFRNLAIQSKGKKLIEDILNQVWVS